MNLTARYRIVYHSNVPTNRRCPRRRGRFVAIRSLPPPSLPLPLCPCPSPSASTIHSALSLSVELCAGSARKGVLVKGGFSHGGKVASLYELTSLFRYVFPPPFFSSSFSFSRGGGAKSVNLICYGNCNFFFLRETHRWNGDERDCWELLIEKWLSVDTLSLPETEGGKIV